MACCHLPVHQTPSREVGLEPEVKGGYNMVIYMTMWSTPWKS